MESISLIEKFNKKNWWHSPPRDESSYRKRGVFLASSFKECEFYGRPLEEPVRVSISHLLIDTEENIIKMFFADGSFQKNAYKSLLSNTAKNLLSVRFKLDADIYGIAKRKGYDAIAIVTTEGLKKIQEGTLPRSIELNVFDVYNTNLQFRKRVTNE